MSVTESTLTDGTVLEHIYADGRPTVTCTVQIVNGLRQYLVNGLAYNKISGAAVAAAGGGSHNGNVYWSVVGTKTAGVSRSAGSVKTSRTTSDGTGVLYTYIRATDVAEQIALLDVLSGEKPSDENGIRAWDLVRTSAAALRMAMNTLTASRMAALHAAEIVAAREAAAAANAKVAALSAMVDPDTTDEYGLPLPVQPTTVTEVAAAAVVAAGKSKK